MTAILTKNLSHLNKPGQTGPKLGGVYKNQVAEADPLAAHRPKIEAALHQRAGRSAAPAGTGGAMLPPGSGGSTGLVPQPSASGGGDGGSAAAAGPVATEADGPTSRAIRGLGVSRLTPADVVAPPTPTGSTSQPYGDHSVAKVVSDLTAQDSPLMQQARADGARTANRRGLLNSSMAAGAAEQEMLRVAVPIASQEAAQRFQQNISLQNFGQERTLQSERIRSQEKLTEAELRSREAIAAAEIQSQEDRLDRQLTHDEKKQIRDHAHQLVVQERDFAGRGGLLGAELSSRERISASEMTSRERMQGNELTSRERMQGNEIAANASERGLDRSLQERIADWNLSASDRNQAMAAALDAERTYQGAVASINANTNLDAGARAQQLQAALNSYNQQLQFIERLFNIDLDFSGNGTPSTASTTPAPSPAPETPAPPMLPPPTSPGLAPSGKTYEPGTKIYDTDLKVWRFA